VWREPMLVVDGHTRREAAIAAGITDIPVCLHDFSSEDEAVVYAIKAQTERRNLTDAEVYRVTLEIDRRMKSGERTDLASSEARSHKSAEDTASKIGASRAKVEAVRTIEDHADKFPDIKDDVLNGKKSIRMGAREVSDRKRKDRGAYEPVVPPPVEHNGPQPSCSSVVKATDADREWLASFPLRARVVASRFDEDALIYRHFATGLGAVRGELQQLIGLRSPEHASTLYSVLLKLSPLPSINTWTVCDKCGGKGGKCRPCHGGGYTIPGL
jgi:hypothetical protein